jgi:5'-nucleotidase
MCIVAYTLRANSEAQGLQRFYYAKEVDPHIDQQAKTKYMVEWVEKAHDLLMLAGFNKRVIAEAVSTGNIVVRDGWEDLFDTIERHKVPFLVFSAGIADVLEEVGRLPHTFLACEVLVSFRC